ncbi:hypothetical protein AAVH_16041, partial [Aphelenchoides avenae]
MEKIHIAGGVVNFRQAGLLDEVISACRFEQFSIKCLYMPDWQINDDFLRRLGRVGCSKVDLSKLMSVSPAFSNADFVATDDGILDYCFSPDLGALGSRERTLWVHAGVSIGPTFFKKCIQAHFESHVTAQMELELHKGDTARYDVSGFLEHLAEYAAHRLDDFEDSGSTLVCYDIPDRGDGVRLLIKFRFSDDFPFHHSRLLVRRGHKDDEAFFLRPFAFSFGM